MIFFYIAIILLLALILIIYYLKLIWNNSLIPRYSNKYSIELHQGPSTFDNHLMYWIDVRKSIFREGIYEFDEQGVFIFNEQNIKFYHPAGIPLAFLLFLNDYVTTKDESLIPKIKSQLDWILQNYTPINDDRIVWFYHYDHEGNIAPWSSGIAQGFAISALARASILFKNPLYLELAEKAFNQMQTPLNEGGHAFTNNHYKLWYEEATQPTHILNGHIYSLMGVYDLYLITGKEKYKEYFDQGVVTITENIHDFDLGFFSKYCATRPFTSNNSYHHIHMRQFEVLYHITKNPFFETYAHKMNNQYHSFSMKLKHLYYLTFQLLQSKF